MYNPNSLDTLCTALCYAMGITPPEGSATANEDLCQYIDEALAGEKCDRIFMYNPDAVAQWIFEKYPQLFEGTTERTDIKIPLCSVLPSVTPVSLALLLCVVLQKK